MRTLLSLILVQLAIVFLLCVTVHGQQTIEDKRITIHMQRAAFGKVIETLIEDYDVAIGFEQASNMDAEAVWDFNFEPNVRHQLEIPGQVLSPAPLEFHVKKHWITVNFDEEKLSAVLDSIVRQMPGYRWQISDDVVNILPTTRKDELLEKLLKLKISKFELKDPYIFEIQRDLLALPELARFLNEGGVCTINLDEQRRVFNLRRLPKELRFSDLTLRELLNRVTKIKRGGWIVRRKMHEKNIYRCLNIQI